MLLFLLSFFHSRWGISIPSVFGYYSTRMIFAALFSVGLTIFLGKPFIKRLYALRIGQPIRNEKECPQLYQLHGKKQDTPTMGGVLILSSIAVSLFLFMDLTHSFTWILLGSLVTFGMLGALDDFWKLKRKNAKGIAPKKKLLVQILFASLLSLYLLCPSFTEWVSWVKAPQAKEFVSSKEKSSLNTEEYASKIYLPFMKKPVLSLQGPFVFLLFFLILFVVTGSSNAVNLADGLDGLAAGLLVLACSTFAVIAFFTNNIQIARYLNILYVEGSGEIAVFLTAMAGASLGFLWYNGYPAQVFMGDTGSLALGGSLGVCSVLLRKEFLLALVGGMFVVEALSVIIQVLSFRYRNQKRVFLCAPLHHHFEYRGWPETKVVLRFWIIGLFLSLIGLASLKFQ